MTRSVLGYLAILLFSAWGSFIYAADISGEMRRWHKVTLTFDGPSLCEDSWDNPFLNYKLDVTFKHPNDTLVVPGYFAADGDAAESSATCGTKWRVHFSPPFQGTWEYEVSFKTGGNVAVGTWTGSSTAFDGETGSFSIGASNKFGRDFRAHGLLEYADKHYLRHRGSKQYFVHSGTGSPENFLAYREFDDTYVDPDGPGIDYTHLYAPHISDYAVGDPSWQGGKGQGIIGALNYLHSVGVNSFYFMTFTEQGDGDDVWPWTGPETYDQFDVSKLDQWEIVFSHMDSLGILMHVVMQEQENDQLLDGGNLGNDRTIYYRELIARFGHHLGLIWNLGEENTNSDWQRKQHASYIRDTDPYNHLILTHTYSFDKAAVYNPLLTFDDYEGASLQVPSSGFTDDDTEEWVTSSFSSGRPWVVIMSEIGPANDGVVPDSYDWNHDDVRKGFLWPHLMHGGAGVEWYFGYNYPHSDLTCEDFRSRQNMWDQTLIAREFWEKLPFSRMEARNDLVSRFETYCFANPGRIYVVHLPNGDWTDLTLEAGSYRWGWFDPKNGGLPIEEPGFTLAADGDFRIENPPSWGDWVAIVVKVGSLREAEFFSDAAKIKVFPQPAQDQIIVQFASNDESRIELIDLQGKVVKAWNGAAINQRPLSVSELARGMYTLRLYQGNTPVEALPILLQ